MDPINPLDRLNAILHKRIGEGVGLKAKTASGSSDSASGVTVQRSVSPEALRKRIASSIEALDPNDPEQKKKAARIFVENVLAWQFGDALLNDSRFVALIEEVQEVLEREPGFHESLITTMKQVGERR